MTPEVTERVFPPAIAMLIFVVILAMSILQSKRRQKAPG
jgi:hypothetical protein